MKRLVSIAICMMLAGCTSSMESVESNAPSGADSHENANQQVDEEPTAVAEQPSVTSPARSEAFLLSAEAVSQAQELIDSSHKSSPSQVLVSENVGTNVASLTLIALDTATSMWDERYGVIEDYEVVVFTAQDSGWVESIRQENRDRIWLGSFETHLAGMESCSFGVAVDRRMYICLPDGQSAPELAALVPHEYFHSIQNRIGITTQLPIWLTEGTAAFFGDIALPLSGEELTEERGDRRSLAMSEFLGSPKLYYNLDALTEEKFLQIIKALEIPPVNSNAVAALADNEGYLWSSLAVQFLVVEHGVDGVLNYLESVGAGETWKTQFQTSFGQTADSFYAELREHIISTYTR